MLYNHLTDTFSDAQLRRAFDLAIDRAALAEQLGVTATAATGCVPDGISDAPESGEDFRTAGGALCAANAEGYAERSAEAARLMTSAGHYQGAGLPTLRFLFVEGEQTRAAALSLFNMWRTATGVAVELVGVSAEELDAALAAGDFDLALTTLTARCDDPMEYLLPFRGTSESNVCGYRNDTFDLLDDIEKELGIATCPINWPIGSGKEFQGVYDREKKCVIAYSDTEKGTKEGTSTEIPIQDEEHLKELIGEDAADKLLGEVELLDGASAEFDLEEVQKGNLTPVCFGSALTNFGVEIFLKHFLNMTTTPLPRKADIGMINPTEHEFSAFVFKIQANMNKAHRDRIAFMRICSGKFDANMEVRHVQGNKVMRLSQPQQIMADERKILNEAYAGDIIGVFDPGIFSIGDTLCMPREKFQYEGIPTFAPEHFARVRQVDTMKRKQFVKGVEQIAQEGAIQIFQEFNTGLEEIIRWIENKDEIDLAKLSCTSDMKKVKDMKGNPLLLFVNSWSIGMTLDRNKGLVLTEFGRN